jgi:tetratricopeptide (TPR) repeat protein
MGLVALRVALLLFPAAVSAHDAPEAQRIFEDYGGLTQASVDDEGTVWLSLWEPHIRYHLAGESAQRLAALQTVVERADQGQRAVKVRYDAAKGKVDRKTGQIDYPLCRIALDEISFEPARPCKASPAEPPRSGEEALVLANAHAAVGRGALAVRLLDRSDFPADPIFRKLLLTVRAGAEEGVAMAAAPASEEADTALAAALGDHRELAKLEPDEAQHQLSIASVLIDLGGYAEAGAVYDGMRTKWPDEEYRIAVNTAALHRTQGDYAKALRILDRFVERRGPQPGMKFHYHRGWLLGLLSRHEEAIAEFTEGLKNQPDYSSAYLRRACSLAAMGRLREALDDVGKASALYAALPFAESSKWLDEEIAEASGFRQRLETAIAAGDDKPLKDVCAASNWKVLERPRARSRFLLPA